MNVFYIECQVNIGITIKGRRLISL